VSRRRNYRGRLPCPRERPTIGRLATRVGRAVRSPTQSWAAASEVRAPRCPAVRRVRRSKQAGCDDLDLAIGRATAPAAPTSSPEGSCLTIISASGVLCEHRSVSVVASSSSSAPSVVTGCTSLDVAERPLRADRAHGP
jgi:hypothetical protein